MWYIEKLLGQNRAKRMIPLKSMIEAGILVAGGSDAPVTLIDPITGIYSACNHPNPDQRLNVLDALRLYNTNAASIAFEEKEKGSLEPGKVADFIVLDKNPFDVAPDKLKTITIEAKYLNSNRTRPQNVGMSYFVVNLLKRKLFG